MSKFSRLIGTLCAVLALTVAAPAAHAQLAPRYITGATLTGTPVTACISAGDNDTAVVATNATMTAIVRGTATSLTVSFMATSVNGPTTASQWVALPMVPVGSGNGPAALTTTAVGTFTAPVAGFRQVCAYISTYSSGSVAIDWSPSDKPNPALTPDTMRVPFNCILAVSSATGAANFTAAAGFESACTSVIGLRFYITDVSFGSTVISTASLYPIIEYSTTLTTTCATAPKIIWQGQSLAFTTISDHFKVPIVTPQSVDLCVLHGGTGSKTVQIQGYLAP